MYHITIISTTTIGMTHQKATVFIVDFVLLGRAQPDTRDDAPTFFHSISSQPKQDYNVPHIRTTSQKRMRMDCPGSGE